MQRLNRPALVLLALAIFIGGFSAYFALSISIFKSGPTEDELWPGTAEWARDRLAAMTIEQKISQLFSVRAYSHYTSSDDPAYRSLVEFVERFEIGGITFFQGEPLEQATLANDLQARSRVPLLIAQDMEWGAGMRIEHTTTFPRTMALGATRDTDLAYKAGFVTAREARALGTQQVFAPVADINNNPSNPIINVRSFGEKPDMVAEMATAFAMGVQSGGAIATAKHFPGHGDTDTDSHAALPILRFGMDRLETVELVPFRKLVDSGIMSIMMGHLAFPQVEPDSTVPATLSSRITTEILRKELDFNGLIVTDALDMAGVTANFSTGEAALRAFRAGADMLLLSEDPYAARTAILSAVERGEISESRIDESVTRILRAKAWSGLAENTQVDLAQIREIVASEPHLALAETIARKSLTLLRNEEGAVPLSEAKRVLVVTMSDGSDPDVGRTFTNHLRRQLNGARLDVQLLDDRSHAGDYERVLSIASGYDAVVVPAFVYVRSWSGRINLAQKNLDFMTKLIGGDKPVVFISFGNPYIISGLPMPKAYMTAYGASDASQRAAADALAGMAGFHGRLPITIPGLYNYGSGIELPQGMIRPGYPSEAGMSGNRLAAVDSLIHAAMRERAFPGAAVAIGRGGVITKIGAYGYHTYDNRRPVTTRSQFDMASLTKVVATTTAVMKLYEEGRLDLDDRVVEYLPEFSPHGKDRITLRHLLRHTSGLIPFRSFHRMGVTSRQALIDSIMAEKLVYEIDSEARYSDFNMILTMLIIEKITGQDFATYTRREIFEPLGMYRTGFFGTGKTDSTVVPTEVDHLFRKRLIQGEVHDETAWILGGTAGHAGLFSTVEDLSRFAYMLLNGGRVNGRQFLKEETIRGFTKAQDPGRHTRALGWDTPSPEGYTSAGRHFGRNSFGHTGFTGTSIWLDPDQDLFVILLTNRVYPTRENLKISQVRPKLADIAAEAVIGPVELVLAER